MEEPEWPFSNRVSSRAISCQLGLTLQLQILGFLAITLATSLYSWLAFRHLDCIVTLQESLLTGFLGRQDAMKLTLTQKGTLRFSMVRS